ncbi:YciI family protein [Gammaproteobacteria bacterium]|jgi:uncharacterized protein YciI|nr:YciI family protein [Gammaproteobacteria bacterium]MBT4781342.1 YciI family protein [Gammaproteobacteria bacterium]MBT5907176.1 YciI family protein [Gammaproteobacteria bacterium]MBT6315268.1 YciI family protein [Gammaproteobacteria bacterium]MBT6547868.1 YciI family protein [Gammaproteobacteria bacterium]
MLFSLVSQDNENSTERRMSARPAHLERLQALSDAGRLVVAGPSPINPNGDTDQGFSGSVVIADFASLEDAKTWADGDPYVSAGVYASVSVKPFKRVF